MTTLSFSSPSATIPLTKCDGDQTIRLDLALADFDGNATLELWIAPDGNDCGDVTSRMGVNATCTKLATLPLAQTTGADVSVHALGVCADAGSSAASVEAIYLAPGDTSTPAATASTTIRVQTGASDSTAASDDSGGCTASGHPIETSWLFGFVAIALWAFVRRRRGVSP